MVGAQVCGHGRAGGRVAAHGIRGLFGTTGQCVLDGVYETCQCVGRSRGVGAVEDHAPQRIPCGGNVSCLRVPGRTVRIAACTGTYPCRKGSFGRRHCRIGPRGDGGADLSEYVAGDETIYVRFRHQFVLCAGTIGRDAGDDAFSCAHGLFCWTGGRTVLSDRREHLRIASSVGLFGEVGTLLDQAGGVGIPALSAACFCGDVRGGACCVC